VLRYFDLILYKLSDKIHQTDHEKKSPLYHSLSVLRNEIRLAPQSKWTVDLIAQKMKMSRSYIQHLYKQFFGVSITEDIQSSRIEYAKYLLSLTNEKISSIAESCGYESDVHFMRIFKKATSMTPSEFRRGH
jgi:AraC family transcriptional regulator of arabinose operon